jgi:hypothetical protein
MRFGASASAGPPQRTGERALPRSMKAPRRPSRRSWSTGLTRTVICSWSYVATSGATGQLVSADPTGTSSSTRVASVGSSTSAKPATRRVLWLPSGQSPWGSRSCSPGLALHERTRSVSSRRLGPRKDDGRDAGAKSSLREAYRNRTAIGLVQSRT